MSNISDVWIHIFEQIKYDLLEDKIISATEIKNATSLNHGCCVNRIRKKTGPKYSRKTICVLYPLKTAIIC